MPKKMRRRYRHRGSTLRNFESVITSQSLGEQLIAKLFDIYYCIPYIAEPARHIKLSEFEQMLNINIEHLDICTLYL